MPNIVYRIIEVLSVLVADLPMGTNLAVLHLLWAVVSGRLLASRGAIIPALAASGLPNEAVRRAWAALAYGAWDITTLLQAFQRLVGQEGRWQRRVVAGLGAVAVDQVGFFRPRLKDCPTKHYASQFGKSLPAIPFGMVTAIGAVGDQTVPLLRDVLRAPDNVTLLRAAQASLGDDAFLVADSGFHLSEMQAGDVTRYVLRVANNFTARRASLPAYRGCGRRPTRGEIVRPGPRRYRQRLIPATPPDRTERWQEGEYVIEAGIWDELVAAEAMPGAPTFTCYYIKHPAFDRPLVLVTSLENLSAAQAAKAYGARWPVEQVPQAAKQMLGAHRQFVFGEDSRQRLPELALLAGSLLMYLAATQPAQATGFWDRAPKPTAGRLRRSLARHPFSEHWPLPPQLRKKNSITDHLPKGISGHRRVPNARPAFASPSQPPGAAGFTGN